MYVKKKQVDFPAEIWEQIQEIATAGKTSAQKAIIMLILEALERRQKGKRK